MENQLTEFIALTCYEARNTFDQKIVPEGVLEKIIAIARRLGIHIEGTGIRLSRWGGQAVWRGPTLVIEPEVVNLKQLTSKYFERNDSGGATVFSNTQYFADEVFPFISQKDYVSSYESYSSTLLGIWRLPGGLENLVYLSLAGEDGIEALAADLEIILRTLREYVRTEIYLNTGRSTKNPSRLLADVKSTAAALQHKVSILQKSDEYRSKLEALPKTVYVNRLLASQQCFPEQCFLWDITEWLGQVLVETAETLLEQPSNLPLMQSTIVPPMEEIVRRMYSVTNDTPVLPEGDTVSRLTGLFDLIEQKTLSWLRAILSKYENEYFDLHRQNKWITGVRNIVICFDVKRSTRILDELIRIGPKNLPKHIDMWRSKAAATPRNWAILFDGVLKAEGDQEIAFFTGFSQGLTSMSFALTHIDCLESVNPHKSLFHLGLKAGIGSSIVFIAAEQENSPAINHVFHAIDDLTKVTIAQEQWKSSALALDDFVKEHEQVRQFCTVAIDYKDGTAHVLDYCKVTEEYACKMRGN